MEIINLRRIIPAALQDEINKFVAEFVDGSPYKIVLGQVIVTEPVLGRNAVYQLIVSSVCDYFKVSESVVLSKTRKVPFCMYRQIIMYFSNMYLDADQEEIATMMGHRRRSSVSHGLTTIKNINHERKRENNLHF
jgi:chromosomal replication initiation ATPase DnaA